MEIKELQEKVCNVIDEVDEKRGAVKDVEMIFLHLVEEIGEISREIVNPKLGRDETNIENLKEEIADCLMLILKLSKFYNMNIEEEVLIKLEKLKNRVLK